MKGAEDGDLFPRNAAPGATPRIKRRNGEVLFHPQAKRVRLSRGTDESPPEKSAPVTKFGSSLTLKRVCDGMITLALITRCNEDEISVTLPSGVRAEVIDETLVDDEQLARIWTQAFQNSQSQMDVEMSEDDDESDGDESDENESEDDASEDAGSDSGEDGENEDEIINAKPLWKVLRVGQILPAAVVSTGNQNDSQNIQVSFKPHLVNVGLSPTYLFKKNFPAYAAVLSIEDHGYVLSFGSNISHSGFLPFDKCDPLYNGSRMSVGTPVRVITDSNISVPKTKRNSSIPIRVSAQQERVNKSAVEALDSPATHDLCAGMLVRARVVQDGPGGLSLLAFGLIQINVDANHIPSNSSGRTIEKDKTVAARILYVDAASHLVGASLLDCFVNDLAPPLLPKSWKVGTLLKPLKVKLIRSGYGLSLRYDPKTDNDEHHDDDDDGDDDDDDDDDSMTVEEEEEDLEALKMVSVFAGMSRVSDTKVKNLGSKFHEGMRIPKGGRIFSLSKLDGVVNVDLRESLLSRKAITIDEIEIGSIYNCKVVGLEVGKISVHVEGDPTLQGIIQIHHAADVAFSEKKLTAHKSFRPGATVKCVAMSKSAKFGSRRVILSARRSLVSPRHPLLTSLEDLAARLQNVDSESHASKPIYSGTVENVSAKLGLVISFCNHIRGYVPNMQLALDTGMGSDDRKSKRPQKSDILDLYPIHQTVYVRVLSVDPAAKKLILSMNLEDTERSPVQPGEFLSGRIVGVDKELECFDVIVNKHVGKGSTRTKEMKRKIHCLLPFHHLSDMMALSKRVATELISILAGKNEHENKSVRNLSVCPVVLQNRGDGIILSMKESLRTDCRKGQLPKSFNDVTKLVSNSDSSNKQTLSGYVKSISQNGAIIGFLGNLVGFVPLGKITDSFISDAAHVLTVNQSVTAVVLDLNPKINRLVLSTRLKDVGTRMEELTRSLFSCFHRWGIVLKRPQLEKELKIGSLVQATVTKVRSKTVHFSLKTSNGDVAAVGNNIDGAKAKNLELFNLLGRSENVTGGEQPSSSQPTVGEVRNVRVLDIDPLSRLVDATHEAHFISCSDLTGKFNPTRESNTRDSNRYPAKVIAVKETHVVLLVSTQSPILASALACEQYNAKTLEIGSNVKVQCLNVAATRDRNLAVIEGAWDGQLKIKAKSSTSRSPKVIDKIKSAFRTGDESAIVGLKIEGTVFEHHTSHVRMKIFDGVHGYLHISNTGHVSSEELDGIGVGPLPEKLRARYKLPPIKTKIQAAYILGFHQRSGNPDENVISLNVGLSDIVPQRPLKADTSVIGFFEQSLLNNVTKSDRWINIMIDQATEVYCAHVDSLTEHGVTVDLPSMTPVKCTILKESKGVYYGILSDNGCNGWSDQGSFFWALFNNNHTGRNVMVEIPTLARSEKRKSKSLRDIVVCDVSDDYEKTVGMLPKLRKGDPVRVRHLSILECEGAHQQEDVLLTMRAEIKKSRTDALIDKPTFLEQLKEGKLKIGNKLRGFVHSFTDDGCCITIGRNIVGYFSSEGPHNKPANILKKEYPIGTLISGYITKFPTDEKAKNCRLELSLQRIADAVKTDASNPNSANGKEGTVKKDFFPGTVHETLPELGIIVSVPKTRSKRNFSSNRKLVSICDISDNYDHTVKVMSELKKGDSVRVRYVNEKRSRGPRENKRDEQLLSMRAIQDEETSSNGKDALIIPKTVGKLKEGDEIRGFVRDTSEKGCFLNIGRNIIGHVKLNKLSNDFVESPENEFPAGKLVSGCIETVSVGKDGNCRISMSLKNSGAGGNGKFAGKLKLDYLKEGDVVNGVVRKIASHRIHVIISKGLSGILHVSHIDKMVDTNEDFVVGQQLTCVVILREQNKVELGTKRAYFEASHLPAEEIENIIEKNETSLSDALQFAHHGHLSINYDNLGLYQSNEIIRANIEKEDNIVDELHDSEEDHEESALQLSKSNSKQHQNSESDGSDEEDPDDNENQDNVPMADVNSDDGEESEDAIPEHENAMGLERADDPVAIAPLKVKKFDFSDMETGVDNAKIEDDDNQLEGKARQRTSKDKRDKKRRKETIENETRLREEALARDDTAAETAEDFERLLIGEPNSSYVWIRYMGLCVELAQLEKARSIAERALTTIAVDKEDERLNIWVAYVNLEASFGGMNAGDANASDTLGLKRDAAIMRVFERGCQRVNNVKGFHLKVANALDNVNDKMCETVLRRATKKFKEMPEVWFALGEYYFKRGELNQAQHTQERALMSLPKTVHTQLISKFAQMEYKHGNVERGRTVFESLIGNFPKRNDLWNVYLDMETKQCHNAAELKKADDEATVLAFNQAVERTRRTFERFASLNLSTKKTKFAFTKWMDFEKKYGTADDIKVVKDKAREYVNKMKE